MTVQTSGTRNPEKSEYNCASKNRKTAKKNAAKSCWRDIPCVVADFSCLFKCFPSCEQQPAECWLRLGCGWSRVRAHRADRLPHGYSNELHFPNDPADQLDCGAITGVNSIKQSQD